MYGKRHDVSMVSFALGIARRPASMNSNGLTCDTLPLVSEVTIRELRNHGGAVVDRVAAGERVTVTRAGKPVAELRPTGAPPVGAAVLLERWRRLPTVDPVALRADLDAVVSGSL